MDCMRVHTYVRKYICSLLLFIHVHRCTKLVMHWCVRIFHVLRINERRSILAISQMAIYDVQWCMTVRVCNAAKRPPDPHPAHKQTTGATMNFCMAN